MQLVTASLTAVFISVIYEIIGLSLNAKNEITLLARDSFTETELNVTVK